MYYIKAGYFGAGISLDDFIGFDISIPGHFGVRVKLVETVATLYTGFNYGGVSGAHGGGMIDYVPVDPEYENMVLSLNGKRIRMIFHDSVVHKGGTDFEFWVYTSEGKPEIVVPRMAVNFKGMIMGSADVDGTVHYKRTEYPN